MQNYKTVKDTDSIQSSREIFNNAITSAVSNNSGAAFPTDNLVVGMKCYRTDLGKTYTLTDVDNKTWTEDSHAESADTATKLATARTISLSGKATGSASFDGSANVAINVTAVTADSCTGNAATASAVAWTGITGKPSTYTPSSHNHDSSYPSTSGSRATGTWGISVTGTSANVTQKKSATAVTHTDYNNNQTYLPDMSFLSFWNGAYNSSNSSNLKYSANGTIIGSNNIGSQSVNYANSAKTASYPSGFSANSTSSATWGNQTGSAVADWSDGAGGDIQFRKNNPANGQLSVLVDGLFYQREGKCACIDTSTIGSQSVKYATSAGTATTANAVAWGNVTGKPSTYTPATHTHAYLPLTGGTTTGKVNMQSATLDNMPQIKRTDNAYFAGIRCENTNGYLGAIGMTGTKDSAIVRVNTSGTTYTVLDSSNYNSYAPTKTGSGASGTWGISISGNAATATKSTSCTGNSATATKLATARTISLSGKAAGSASFDGSANVSINVTSVAATSCTGNSATASAVAWSGVSSKPASIVKVSSWDGSTLKLTTCT